jgi:hypothetical protein
MKHLIVSVHYHVFYFILATSMGLMTALEPFPMPGLVRSLFETVLDIGISLVPLLYMFEMLRALFPQKTWITAIKAFDLYLFYHIIITTAYMALSGFWRMLM